MAQRPPASPRRRTVLAARVDRALTEHGLVVPTLLVLLGLLVAVLIALWPTIWPVSALAVPMLLGHLMLAPRFLGRYLVFCGVLLLFALLAQPAFGTGTIVRTLVILAIGVIVLIASQRRSRLGVGGSQGESMFADLRDRIVRHGELALLPPEWSVESATRAAGGTPFNGDFIVSARRGEHFRVAVVDVSGKGTQAGVRALQLSGALGGLIGALPPERFLEEANAFLCDQDWDEGFATAVYLSLHLPSGEMELRAAGHLPALQWSAGTGRWAALETSGPALGLLPGSTYAERRGLLRPGDALVLYTDGVVESTSDDISLGIDRLLGQAERALAAGFDGMAERLVDVRKTNDDRTLLLLHRR